MSHISTKDIDRQNEERMLWTRIWESFHAFSGNPNQRDIDNFNENTENAKKEREYELYHQGDEEEGELMQVHEHEEDEDGDL